ncbi:MAG: hypothetical protein IIB44_12370 [Candidatus Marinimicrobia bacterium]|nr:hypothetical protein [Candidatus Neomarinimicrobiota bacterium]
MSHFTALAGYETRTGSTSLGFSFRLSSFTVDYGVKWHRVLGISTMLSMGITLYKP